MNLGAYNRLKIVKSVDFGVYLDGGKDGEILLPARYVPKDAHIGDEIEVFIYLDQDERLIATTEHPLAQVGDFAFLKCSWVNQYGAFLDWGLMKDLFCPFREQKMRMERDKGYIVYVMIDEESYRIMATAKVDRYLNDDIPPYRHGDEVELLVWQKTELGFKVIVDNQYAGLVYRDQLFSDIHTGDRIRGFVDNVRPDGKLDITLQPTGRRATTDFSEVLLDYLEQNGGICDLGDKSDAEDIRERFGVSKKTFKRAVGDLYKRRLITISDTEIRLIITD
ncbi:MAG: GntR family transcriptional regulator [Prevotella sp.]|nr:GntR family transcriptional regulator [Prevotella sp.]